MKKFLPLLILFVLLILSSGIGATFFISGGSPPPQTLGFISLSNTTFSGGTLNAPVGAVSVIMSPSSPVFVGSLGFSTTQGGCTAETGADNASFQFSGSNIQTAGTLAPAVYHVCVTATQAGISNSPIGQAFTITGTQTIVSLGLSNSTFVGGSPTNTVVGALSVVMNPTSPVFSGSLSMSTTVTGCTSINGANNSSFSISGSNLVTNGVIGIGSYNVCIAATQASATNSPQGQAFVITGGQNIVSVGLSANTVPGGSPTNTVVGTLSTVLTPAAPAFTGTFSLSTSAPNCTPTNGANNASFNISGSSLRTTGVIAVGTYQVCAVATQAGVLNSPQGQPFTITATQSFSSVNLSNSTFVGGSPTNTVVGALSATMNPVVPAFTGSLALSTTQGGCTAGNGSGNANFNINAGNLRTTGVVPAGSYNVCVAATQAGITNSPLGQAFVITGTSGAQTIVSINLPSTNFPGGSPSGTTVGPITVTMSPPTPVFSGTLVLDAACGVNCTDSSKFQLAGAGCANGGTCNLATAVGTPVNPTFVKGNGAASANLTVTGGIPAGSMVLGSVQWDTTGSAVSAISDGTNSYSLSAITTDTTHVQAARCFWNTNTTGAPTTLTSTGGSSSPAITANIYSGAATTLDVVPVSGPVVTAAAGGAVNATPITTTQTNDLVWSAYAETTQGTSTMTARAPATARITTPASIMLSEDQTQALAGSVTAAATATSAGSSIIPCVAAMKQSVTGLANGAYQISVIAAQSGITSVETHFTVNGVNAPTSVSLVPSSATVSDNCTVAGCSTSISTATAVMSGGAFAGTWASNNTICAISAGGVITVGRTLTSADDGVKTCTITATQNSVSAQSNLSVTVQAPTITTVNLSGTNVPSGSPSGTVVGTISVVTSPVQPGFTGTFALGTGGGCPGTNNANFNVTGGTSLVTAGGVLANGSYAICLVATQTGATGSPFAQAFNIIVGASPEIPGPSASLFASPPYVCNTNFFVTPAGAGSHNGTVGNEWTIAQAAASATPTAGSCINLAAGTYSGTPNITLTHGGNAATPSGYVVWRGAGLTAGVPTTHIVGAAQGGNIFDVSAAYLWFDGVWVDGNNAAVLENCFDINGGVNGDGTGIHHMWITNSIIEGCGQANLQFNATEWLFVNHDVIRHGAFNPAFVVASGYSVYQPWRKGGYTPTTCSVNCSGNQKFAYDNYWCSASPWAFCYQIVTTYTVFYNNYNPSGSSDGEGFEHDAWNHGQNAPNTPYTGSSLDMGNIYYFNGGRGVQMFQCGTANQIVVNNTAYNNNMDTTTNNTFRGDIQVNDTCSNVKIFNNIAYATTGGGGSTNSNTAFMSAQSVGGNVWQNNIGFGANDINSPDTYPTTGPPNGNLANTNPRLVDVTPGTWATHTPGHSNFALCTGTNVPVSGCVSSPAIHFGQVFSLWQQTTPGAIDVGACVSTLTTCP